MSRNIWKRTAMGFITAALLSTPVFAKTTGGAIVRTADTGLNLRESASTSSAALAVAPNGSFLLVEDSLDGWYQVVYNGKTGYVSADFVEYAETLSGNYLYGGSTAGTNVNIRSESNTTSKVVKCLKETGTGLVITGVDGNWLRVSDGDGNDGYIRSDLVNYKAGDATGSTVVYYPTQSVEPVHISDVLPADEIYEAVEVSGSNDTGADIVATAKEYLGYRYKWGGSSPSSGFDCSGFVNYIYGLYGYSMERVAQSIYNTNGTAVSKDQLQPGDLLFFGSSSRNITHVGIYAGDNQMVHSSNSRTGVIVSDLTTNYYVRMYVGAKRIIG